MKSQFGRYVLLDVNMIIGLFGGLGLFLYGMKLMGDGLENAAGSKLKFILNKVTANPLSSVMIGAIVTVLMQSSSATTVMVIGFVNSGLLNLVQATGIIMGANIGTTTTAFLVSLNIDALVPILIFSGSFLYLFTRAKKRRDVASILLGFGILMLGMELMSEAMYPLRDSEVFKNLILAVGHQWYLGILIGIGITVLVQSSSATTGLLVALTATGGINLAAGFPLILGANIGTCITALLSSITANKTAKKAAIIHLMFNLLGAIIFLPLGRYLITFVEGLSPDNIKLQISFVHLIFNISNTLVLLPFAGLLIKVANKVVGDDDEKVAEILDRRLLQTPSIAEGQVILETVKMAELAKENVRLATEAFIHNDMKHADTVAKNEDRINELTEIITSFLVELSGSDLDVNEFGRIGDTYHVINDIERMGDHAENIMELAQERHRKNVEITKDGCEELKNIFNYTLLAMDTAIESYKNNDRKKALSIIETERRIDDLQREYREAHIRRLNAGRCTALAGILFLDLISNLERIGDHAKNVADTVAEFKERD
ncbi:MAG TPA: sodium-dependent phosphate transporter [Clostridiaceae bacterium]|nr:sodium-dependent phosphate transporter [Clostridiaceae bacterium]